MIQLTKLLSVLFIPIPSATFTEFCKEFDSQSVCVNVNLKGLNEKIIFIDLIIFKKKIKIPT